MNLRKKMQEEKTLSRRQFLTTFRTPMTVDNTIQLAAYAKYNELRLVTTEKKK
jgi:hypothetical protein